MGNIQEKIQVIDKHFNKSHELNKVFHTNYNDKKTKKPEDEIAIFVCTRSENHRIQGEFINKKGMKYHRYRYTVIYLSLNQ